MARAHSLGGAQQPPGGEPVELLDRRPRLVARAAGQMDDRVDAAQRVAPARGIGQIADRQLHPHPLRARAAAGRAPGSAPECPARSDAGRTAWPSNPVAPVSKSTLPPAYATIRRMAYVIAEPCIGTKDNSCVEVCPVDCIHPTPDEPDYDKVEMLFIDPEECIDCDACVEACPVDACFAEDQLPDEWASFAERNAAYYAGR